MVDPVGEIEADDRDTVEPGAQMALSSSTLRHWAQSFSALTTTVRASAATGSSRTSMPLAAQASSSDCLMTRLASAMSISPAQSLLKPPPEPENATDTSTFGLTIAVVSVYLLPFLST